MGASDKVKEIVQDLTGMWWPEGDEDEPSEAARAWRTFADDVESTAMASMPPGRRGGLPGARGGLRGPGFASRRWPCANRPPGVAASLP